MHEDFGEWGYEMSSIRIVVKIPTGTYPELVADLNRVAPRERAERLRLLATIGLRDLYQIEPRTPQHPKSATFSEESSCNRETAASNIIRRLTKHL